MELVKLIERRGGTYIHSQFQHYISLIDTSSLSRLR